MHSHPVPLLGHIESGELTLSEKTGISKTFKEGDSFFSLGKYSCSYNG